MDPTQPVPIPTREWTFLDRSRWPAGPWNAEPDKRQWTDGATGMPCLIVRNRLGGLCGYVGVAPDHPNFGDEYDTLEGLEGIEVHGGLTFAASCQEDAEHGICHVVEPGQPDKVWWFGFDCLHAFDRAPGMTATSGDVYRDIGYVAAEVAGLASQLADLGR